MPVFYLLQAGLSTLGIGWLVAGRFISIIALFAILLLVWRIIERYTGDKYAAWSCAGRGHSQPARFRDTIGQVDVLALAFSLASFYFYSCYRVAGENTVLLAAACSLAGLLTKQTVVAAPTTILFLLIARRPAKALQFAAIVAGLGGTILLGLNLWLDGRFLFNTVFANINPMAWYKVRWQMESAAIVLPPLLLIVALGGRAAIRAAQPPLVHRFHRGSISRHVRQNRLGYELPHRTVGGSHPLFLYRTPLSPLFALTFQQSKSWITLLLLPLGIYVVQNLRLDYRAVLSQAVIGCRMLAAQTAALRPYLSGGGRVLSADIDALLQAHRSIEVEPLGSRLLVEAGRVDSSPLSVDLQAARFSHILLYEDLAGAADYDPETPRLTLEQSELIRRRYQLVRRIPDRIAQVFLCMNQ